ncbi:hypothetical protein ACFWPQ_42225 [Streptomyces sp. NPDC058464]|uniref:hypothetical protein n=1 Tax=Streptomyces sp. NPDC058464 TaxID=3346511 RepID=UPI003669873D
MIVVLTVPRENQQTVLTVVVGVGLGFFRWPFRLRRLIDSGHAGPPGASAG